MDNINVHQMTRDEKLARHQELPIFEEAEQDLSDLAELAEEDLREIEEVQELEEFAELAERGDLEADADEALLDLEKELELPAEVSSVFDAEVPETSFVASAQSKKNDEISQATMDASQEALDLLEMEFSRDDLDLDAELDSEPDDARAIAENFIVAKHRPPRRVVNRCVVD